jgi:hypothetical protein
MKEVPAIRLIEETSLTAAVKEITIAFGRAADATNKAVSYRVEAGFKLRALRKRIEDGEAGEGIVWWNWYNDHFDRSRRDAEKVMALASDRDDPEVAADRERAATRDRMARHRAQPQVTAHVRRDQGGNDSRDNADAEDDSDDPPSPQQVKELFLARAAWAVEWATFSGEPDDEIYKEARLAADAWLKLADKMLTSLCRAQPEERVRH